MTSNLKNSDLEALMVNVLKKEKKPLSLGEVVAEIGKFAPNAFTGQTPTKSLYSIIYRREKRRVEGGNQPLFLTQKERNTSVYILNPKHKGRV